MVDWIKMQFLMLKQGTFQLLKLKDAIFLMIEQDISQIFASLDLNKDTIFDDRAR